MNKILLAVIAAVCFILAFIISFNVSKSSTLKKLEKQRLEEQQSLAAEQSSRDEQQSIENENNNPSAEPGSEAEAGTPENLSALPTPAIVNMPTDSTWSTVLINIYYKMNDDYEPFLAEVEEGSNIHLDERVAAEYLKMAEAAEADGIKLTLAAGYVSADRQERLWDKQVETLKAQGMSQEEAELKASFTVLPPKCNEANFGLSVDIGWLGADFSSSPAYVWLRAHAAEYGFIERYTSDKEGVTHFNACPWHWRYVGADAAKYIRENGISLEEYLGKVK
ncbi:MAG: M15 family metallopeptidase [Oscillospiraceae bacterium]|nr:M15 family metallopeptidase [Oscillospiraceae bacterium]